MSTITPDGQDALALLDEEAAAVAERRRIRRNRLVSLLRSKTFVVGLAIVVFWILMALFSTHLTQNAYVVDPQHALAPPSAQHWLGTDDLGRDVLARTLAGASSVLVIAPLATLLALLWGTTIGLIAGYFKGRVDEIVMRLIDVILAMPIIVTAILVLSTLGNSTGIVILVIAILFTSPISRTVRTATLGVSDSEFVLAARLRGEGTWFILFAELLPNLSSPIIVEGTLRLGYAVFVSATLAFLGMGVVPPSPDWGLTIATERSFIQIAWWAVVCPGIALASLVVGVNLAADGLRRVLVNE